MAKITSVHAIEILDSRANPTIQTTITLDDGSLEMASVPSGASIGEREAVELRDGDPMRFDGKGVLKAVDYVNKVIGPGLTGVDSTRQKEIDQWMIKVDGTENKSKFGANTILSISLALTKASAHSLHVPLYQYINQLFEQKTGMKVAITSIPSPVFNVINGGKHGAGNLDFQEFHIIPSSANTYQEALRIGAELYHKVKKVLIDKNAIHSVGDEGGFAPNLYTNLDALEVIMQAVKESMYRFGEDVFIGLDIAASNFMHNGMYRIRDKQQPFTTDQFIDYLLELNNQYHLLLLEDPLADDWKAWKSLNEKLGDSVIIVGDDLLATNAKLLDRATKEKTCTGILVKPNQIGTVTETLQVVKLAKEHNFKVNVSHRSGETCDTFIADFAVGVQSDYVKFGAPARGERTAKYNRLLEIANELTV